MVLSKKKLCVFTKKGGVNLIWSIIYLLNIYYG